MPESLLPNLDGPRTQEPVDAPGRVLHQALRQMPSDSRMLVQEALVLRRWRLQRPRVAAVARGIAVWDGSGTGEGSGVSASVVAETMRSSILQLAVLAEAVPVPLNP